MTTQQLRETAEAVSLSSLIEEFMEMVNSPYEYAEWISIRDNAKSEQNYLDRLTELREEIDFIGRSALNPAREDVK